MVALNFSTQNVAPNTALEAIPSGVYPVVITRTEEKPTKAGNGGAYIEFEMQIQGGEFNGRKVFDRLNIRNANQQAVDIAYGTLSAICHVCNRHQIQDTGQLHGIPFQAVVAKVGRDDRPGEFSNEVKGYKDAQGNDPGKGTQGAAPGAAPNWAGGQTNGAQPPAQPPQGYAQPPQGQTPQNYGQPPQGYAQPPQQYAPPQGQQPQQPAQPPAWNGPNGGQPNGAPQNAAPPAQPPAQPPQNGAAPQGQAFVPGAAPPWVGAPQGQQPSA